MKKPDKIEQRYEKRQQRKRAARAVVSEDQAPIPDMPVEQAKQAPGVGRNDPCPCGSGRKYKKCCGRPK